MGTKAKDLLRGDEFTLEVACKVLAVETPAGGKLVKIRIALLDSCSVQFAGDGDIAAEFQCRPSRPFQVWRREGWEERRKSLEEEWERAEHAADDTGDGAA